LFSWVVPREEILDNLIAPLNDLDFKITKITLTCSEETLNQRLSGSCDREPLSTERLKKMMETYLSMNTVKVDTTGLSPAMVADRICHIVCLPSSPKEGKWRAEQSLPDLTFETLPESSVGKRAPMKTRSSGVTIIRVGEKDLPKFHALLHWRRTGRPTSGDDLLEQEAVFPEIAKALNDGCLWILAAESDGKYVGYVSAAWVQKPDKRRGFLYVDELWVAPPFRTHGIGHLLMARLDEIAVKLGAWRIRLVTSSRFPTAQKLYRKASYSMEPAIFCEKAVRNDDVPLE